MSQPEPLQKSLPGLWRILAYFWPHLRQYRLLITSSLLALLAEVGVRLLNDVGMLQDVAVTALFPLLAKVLVVSGMIALMYWMQWQLALIAVGVFPLFWLRSISVGRRIREVAQKQRRREGAMAATFAESISAIKTVQALSLEETFARAFTEQSNKSLK